MGVRDQPYCPQCREAKWSWEREDGECEDCETPVVPEWPWGGRAKHRLGQAAGVALIGALLLGPPAYIVARVLEGGPLYTLQTVTVTRTVPEGVLVDIAGPLMIWLMILFIAWAGVSGDLPRRF